MIESKPVQQEIRTLISTKQILIPLFDNELTAKTSVTQRIFNDLVKVEERLICNYQIFIQGRSVEYLKSLLVPTLFLIFFSSCQTQQREQSESQIQVQNTIDIQAKKDRLQAGQNAGEYLKILREYIERARTEKEYKMLSQSLLLKIQKMNVDNNLGLEFQIESEGKKILDLENN